MRLGIRTKLVATLVLASVVPLSLALLGVVLGAGYFLWSYQKVFLGPLNPKYQNLQDMTVREKLAVWPLAIVVVVLGVYPKLYLDVVNPTMARLSADLAQVFPWLKGAGL